jgi:hypothetical protein
MARGTWGGVLDPSIFRVTYRFTLRGQKCQTSFKLRDVATNDNSAQDVADEVHTQLTPGFRNLLLYTDGIELIDVIKIGTEEGGVHLYSPADGQGQVNDGGGPTGVPSFVTANVSLKSEIRKRYGQGRMFVPVVTQEWIDGQFLNNSGNTAIQAWLTAMSDHFMGDPATHDLILVNAHPALPLRGAPGQPGYRAAIPASWYDVVSLRINTTLTTLRSRKAGVGT